MNKKIELSSHVVLIDAAYLNFMLVNLKDFLQKQVNRSLTDVSLADLLAYLAIDANWEEEDRKVQVILVSDKDNEVLANANPTNLRKELDGVAFKSTLGEFCFASAFTEGVVSRKELFLDVLDIVMDAKEVKEMIILSHDDEYGGEVFKKINKKDSGKLITQFRMRKPQGDLFFKWDMLIFPMMKAFGIEGREI